MNNSNKDSESKLNDNKQSFLTVEKIITALKTSDGAGVTLYRSLGSHQLPTVDPFLMLDEFKSDNPNDYIAGFPSHPHRGFETVTYMLAGKMEHKDHKGNVGLIEAGGVQWMTAGRGIIHSEMPIQEDGLMWGFQLWVNLPSNQKMKAPAYQNIEPHEIPEISLENNTIIRVIAGKSMGTEGAAKGIDTDPLFVDIHLQNGASLIHPVVSSHSSLVYVYQGKLGVNDGTDDQQAVIEQGQLAVMSKGDALSIMALKEETRFLLLSGKPINEPVVKHGPFVMNTEAEIQQALEDFHAGRLAT